MSEVSAVHLAKKAYIYVRQSSASQVEHNPESRQVQYNLANRLQQLGWGKERISILDKDLGISAGGSRKRSGFKKLLNHICSGEVGALVFLYASRLARNNWEWHQALEICSMFNTLIIDRERVYNPALPTDRLLLGMQGSFSEYENKQMQIRAQEALLNKAARGQLFSVLPAGFCKTEDDRIELDPDRRVQSAIGLAFSRFEELGSIRQLFLYYKQEGLKFPVREAKYQPKQVVWKPPGYSTFRRLLSNPLYAGIYQYPKTKTISGVDDEGNLFKKTGQPLSAKDKPILIEDLFSGYISKERYYKNQQIIAENANMKGKLVKGAPRNGGTILGGILRCGMCGQKLSIRYSSPDYASYYCPGMGGGCRHSLKNGCLRFSARRLEAQVIDQLLKVLEPQAIDAAMLAEEKFNQARQQRAEELSLALKEAEYEATRIERQLNAVEPEKHLVFSTLTERWQAALLEVEELKKRHEETLASHPPLSLEQRQRLYELAEDLPKLWEHPQSDPVLKTRLLRFLVREIWVATLDDRHLKATIHWQGGVHTKVTFQCSKRPQQQKIIKDQQQLSRIIAQLAAACEDAQIAGVLNQLGCQTSDQKNWTKPMVAQYRAEQQIPPFSAEEYHQQGLLTISQAAKVLNLNNSAVSRLIKKGVLKATQVIKYAPWQIHKNQLTDPEVQIAVQKIKSRTAGREDPLFQK